MVRSEMNVRRGVRPLHAPVMFRTGGGAGGG